ncbi:hypothetical protein SHKM778_56100 [Streptomyces sp. KM77-8]|uniref:Glyoxalase/fosfomycin resistance/dioxygenase domain-containing protein n=1 Tax=Streptomyces haneummycinicus TaxID=3074435 RepID=A0AAT9HPE4_9ACTN
MLTGAEGNEEFMGIQRIESVTYGVDDLDTCVRFFEDFGLSLVERTGEHAVFETRTAQTLHLDTAPGPLLPAPVEDGPTLREVVWGVDTRDDLDRLVTAAAHDHEVRETADGVQHTVDRSGFGVGLALARPRKVTVAPRRTNTYGSVRRWNEALTPVSRAHPCACAMSP